MINKVSMANVAFKGYITDNIAAARDRVATKNTEIAQRKANPLPKPSALKVVWDIFIGDIPITTQRSELARLEGELKSETRVLNYFKKLQAHIEKSGMTTDQIEGIAQKTHELYCPAENKDFCDFDTKAIEETASFSELSNWASETDEFIGKAIRLIRGLKKSGLKITPENIAQIAAGFKK